MRKTKVTSLRPFLEVKDENAECHCLFSLQNFPSIQIILFAQTPLSDPFSTFFNGHVTSQRFSYSNSRRRLNVLHARPVFVILKLSVSFYLFAISLPFSQY